MDVSMTEFTNAVTQIRSMVQRYLRDVSNHIDHVAPVDFERAQTLINVQRQIIERHQQWIESTAQLHASMVQSKVLLDLDSGSVVEPHDDVSHPILDRLRNPDSRDVRRHTLVRPSESTTHRRLTLADSWMHSRPTGFSFAQHEYMTTSYRELYRIIVRAMFEMRTDVFVKTLLNIPGGRTRPFASTNESDFLVAIQVDTIYVEGNLSADTIRNNLKTIMQRLDIADSLVVIVQD
jgi:hypothetical protein